MPAGSLSEVLDSHRVIVTVGSGGVGKTTTAAALALRGAMGGRRVLCLTIDPARRLATSLGLEEMTGDEQVVDPSLFAAQSLECKGSLSAMMLDQKRTFDELVTRYASSPEARDRILGNKLYHYVSTSLAGTQEYMAMEKLHAVKDDPRFDLVVLDTPPTTNALDFLDAPERLVGIIDSPAMRWFLQAFESSHKRLSLRLLSEGASMLLKGLAKFTGGEFLDEIAQFVTDLNDLFGGFQQRAHEVSGALRSKDVAFVIVTSPAPLAVAESIFFAQKLEEAGMPRSGFVINQVHPLHAEPSVGAAELEAAARAVLPATLDPKKMVEKMWRALDDERIRAVADRIEVERLRVHADASSAFVEVPAFEEDVHDLSALARVASHLVGEAKSQVIERV